MKRKSDIFYAKILLFGEYSVIYNSMGLIIPYSHFRGELAFLNRDRYTDFEFAKQSNKQLKDYGAELQELKKSAKLQVNINIEAFVNDINKGLYFESTIPQGFGLGSSAALVASVYSKYAKEKIKSRRHISSKEILKLKNDFAELEAFFHGTSSGVDPLNSYIKYPVLIKGKNQFETVGIPRNENGQDNAIFLLNTGKSRKTGLLVKLFLEKSKDEKYDKAIRQKLIPINNQCIESLIKGDLNEFRVFLKKLSEFQLEYFQEMIPESCKNSWETGLNDDSYYLKLCGAGGGGFVLGFTNE
ncbi:MAG: mevalonate kinase, partial [Bacteroidota bacterium]